MTFSPHHLAFYMPSLNWGGAERTMLKLAGGISTRGYKVDIVLVRAIGAFLSEVPKNVSVIDLGTSRALSSLPSLVDYLRREKPDILYSGLYTNIVALWAKRLARVQTRVVVSERGHLSSHVNMNSFDFRVRMLPQMVRHFYPWADSVVCISKGLADDLVMNYGIPENKICVIYNPIITPELRALADAPLDHPWFKFGVQPVILAAGHLTPQKDFTTLLNAFAMIQQPDRCRLIILGDGEERGNLEELIRQLGVEENVQLSGFVANPYPYMKRASIFILSSRWEGLGGVLIEALYCGVPIIATDCPSGPREILVDGKYGTLVPVGDPLAMARAIDSSLAGDVIYPSAESWQRFEIENILDQYLQLFSNL